MWIIEEGPGIISRVSNHLTYRRLALVAEWALLALVVVLHVAGWLSYHPLATAGPIGQLLADSLPLATLLVVASWCVLGPGYAWVRGGIAAVLLVTSFVATGSSWGATYSWTHNETLLRLAPLATFACAVGLRLCGMRAPVETTEGMPTRGATFTVRDLLAITTAVAVVIGGIEATRPWLRHTSYNNELNAIRVPSAELDLMVVEHIILLAQRQDQLRTGLASALFAIASLLAFAAVLRPGTVWLRLAGLTILIPAAGWYIGHVTETNSDSTVILTLWAAATTAIVAGSLVPLRLIGYRLIRPIQQKRPQVEVQP